MTDTVSEQAIDNREEQRTYWNRRAASFAASCGRDAYSDAFIERLGIEPGASVLDMGCGPGTLALPLARMGCEVLACDISDSMLEHLDKRAHEEGLGVKTKLMAWEDDWGAYGIADKSFDVALASRSIKKKRLPEMIAKMERVARKTVAVTVPSGPAPYVDAFLLEALGRPVPVNRIDVELYNLLANQGKRPYVSYLHHFRAPKFPSQEGLVDDLRRMTGPDPLSEEEERRLIAYADEHTAVEKDGDGSLSYHVDYRLEVIWGLLVWRPDGSAF